MSDFIFPFEYQPVPEALAILNDMDIAPFEITEKHLESWWAEGKIELCFNWNGFWKADLADELAKTENFAALNGKEKITALNVISGSPEANISLVVPSYSDLSFIWRGHSDDPLPSIEAKPYGLDKPFAVKRVPHPCENYCDYGTQHWEKLYHSLHISSMVLPRAEAEKIYYLCSPTAGADGKQSSAKPAKIHTTAKQCRFIVALLRSYNLNDDDFKGSISDLRIKITNRIPSIGDPDVDDNTLIDWLQKAGVR